jgi:hypothetical protein
MGFWTAIKNFFRRIARQFLLMMREVYTEIEQLAMVELKDFATAVCAQLIKTDWSKATKRAEAYKLIVAELIELGFDVGEGCIRVIIETGYKYAKKLPLEALED